MAEDDHVRLTSRAWQRHRAARSLAHHARDAVELRTFLDMFGLTAEEGLVEPVPPPAPTRRELPVKLDAASACRLSNLLLDAHHRPA